MLQKNFGKVVKEDPEKQNQMMLEFRTKEASKKANCWIFWEEQQLSQLLNKPQFQLKFKPQFQSQLFKQLKMSQVRVQKASW